MKAQGGQARGSRVELNPSRSPGLPVQSFLLLLCACSPAPDARAPDNAGDIRVVDGGSNAPKTGAHERDYDYVAERPLAVVALAEARGLSADVAHAAVDRVADALDVCATEQATAGKLADGASRVLAIVAQDGSVSGVNVTFSSGAGVAANGVLCFVAPIRSLVFPPTTSNDQRGIAVEAVWGRDVPHSKPK